MEAPENAVQNQEKTEENGVKKKRSQADKVGKLKYLLQKDRETARDIAEIKLMLRAIYEGFRPRFDFSKPLLEKFACEDEVDRSILQLLFEAGNPGLLPKDVATKLVDFKVMRFQVTRRILRMNRRLEKKLGEQVAERRGWHWALTGFAVEAWGESEKAP